MDDAPATCRNNFNELCTVRQSSHCRLRGGMTGKRVAVIGAGASGLTAIKECLAQGLDPVCFDQDSNVGGLWRYTPLASADTHSSLYDSTVVHTSKQYY
jgi:cation diffusion facilitator CzcD-associated flavoprotein CzcO